MVVTEEVTETELPLQHTLLQLKVEAMEGRTTPEHMVSRSLGLPPPEDQPLEVEQDEAAPSQGRTSSMTTLETPMDLIYGTPVRCDSLLALRLPLGGHYSARPVGGTL